MSALKDNAMGRTGKSFVALAVAILAFFADSSARADRVLVPVVAETPIPGSFGSLWATDLIARNESDAFIQISNLIGCVLPEGCGPPVPPHSTFAIRGFDTAVQPNTGAFLYVPAAVRNLVGFNLRIRDLSRQAQTWGTSIPVVRMNQTYTSTLHLLAIPIDARFRNALRIYDFNFSGGRNVRVRIYEQNSNDALVDTVVSLPPTLNTVGQNPVTPSAVFIGNLVVAFPQLATLRPSEEPGAPPEPRVRIDIDSISPDLQFWAFVSVTNDETQHVTVITPDPPSSQ